jgi:uncharacterized RDD family membrane protein YckC
VLNFTILRRTAAKAIDLIPFVIALPFLFNLPVAAFGQSLIALVILWHLYVILSHFYFGATLGKRAVGLMVVAFNGQSISLVQALLRNSVAIALWAIFFILAAPAIVSGDAEKMTQGNWVQGLHAFWLVADAVALFFTERALHDRIAKTSVIKGMPNKSL